VTVERAQAALDTLRGEAEATRQELALAQHRVGLCVLDVVKGELLAIAGEIGEHERAAAVLRANLDAAGYVTGSLQRRRGWGRIFTTTMLAALRHQSPARPPAPSVDWEAFIAKLYDDPEAELG
jgi:hypothetical protein